MYCRKCGKEIAGQSKFCQYCGASLISENKTNNTGEDYEQPASNIPKSVGKSSMWKLIAGAAVLVLTIVVGAVIISKISKNNSDMTDGSVKTEKDSPSSGLFAKSKWEEKSSILQDFYNSEFEEKAMKDITTDNYEDEEWLNNIDLTGRIYVCNGEPILAVADVHGTNEHLLDVKIYNVVDEEVNVLFTLE